MFAVGKKTNPYPRGPHFCGGSGLYCLSSINCFSELKTSEKVERGKMGIIFNDGPVAEGGPPKAVVAFDTICHERYEMRDKIGEYVHSYF